MVTDIGKNAILDAAVVASWYIGLYTGTADASDTMAAHPDWTEITNYDEAARPEWNHTAAVDGEITDQSVAVATMNGAGTANGLFICSVSTKGGSSGTLLAVVPFLEPVVYVASDTIQLSFTVSLTS